MPSQTLSLSQSQRLQMVLAPQLRQSLEILQMPILELRHMIQQEVEQNPTIEEAPIDTPNVEIEDGPQGQDNSAEMDFAKDETRIITLEYTVWMEGLSVGELKYVLKTGALWKDKIRSADIDVVFQEPFKKKNILKASPRGYKFTKNGLKWQLKNIKPKKDIKIKFICPRIYAKYMELKEKIKKNKKSYKQ